jgi:hypothetical protein
VALAFLHTVLAACTTLAPGWSLQHLFGFKATTATSLQLINAGAYLWLFASCLVCLKVRQRSASRPSIRSSAAHEAWLVGKHGVTSVLCSRKQLASSWHTHGAYRCAKGHEPIHNTKAGTPTTKGQELTGVPLAC